MSSPEPDTLQRDAQGAIWIGGVKLREIASTYGTPFYLMDLATMANRLDAYTDALSKLTVPGRVYYAAKAFFCAAMAGYLANRDNVGLDVVSGGELFTALEGGFPADQIVFHGNAKSSAEIAMAVEAGVGAIVVDNFDELRYLAALGESRPHPIPVILRLTPGIEAHTHEFIRTGQFDSKFGFAMTEGIAEAARDMALAAPGLKVVGVHAHIGSQVFDVEPFVANAKILLEFCGESYRRHGWWPEVIDIGGGIGARYVGTDEPPSVAETLAAVAKEFIRATPSGLPVPVLGLEPGRSIVAEAGVTVYRVEATKTVPGGKRYVMVDGGMGDNIRTALYGAVYSASVDGPARGPSETVTVAGRYCESGDVVIEGGQLTPVEPGDLVAVFTTGAYNYSMASNYNRVPRPPVLAVEEGRVMPWIERESYRDLVRLDRAYKPAVRPLGER